jgi:uncharacterized protein (TIGR03435 family)
MNVRTVFVVFVVAMAVLFAVTRIPLRAQSDAKPLAFEVASIKMNTSGPSLSGGPDPVGRFTARYSTLSMLVARAFSIREAQVEGGQGWSRSDRFDIMATTGGPATSAQRALMLQRLLAERFNLQVHHETRTLPVLELVVARSDRKLGPRLVPASDEDADCNTRGVPKPVFPGGVLVPTCGASMSLTGISVRGETMDRFAQIYLETSLHLGPTVVNHTGLDGAFNLSLEWGNDGKVPEIGTIITALMDQLGLKLTSTKAPIDVVVIDHVEHPTAD